MTDTFWINHILRTGISWVFLLILFIFTIFHCFRMYHASDTGDNKYNTRQTVCIWLKTKICKPGNTKPISYIIIVSTILSVLNQILIYTPTQFHRHHRFTINLCKYTILFAVICKIALHLFVAIRTQIHKNAIKSIYLNLGLFMILSDVLLIVFIVSGLAPTNVSIHSQQLICVPHGPLFVYIWYAINDFVIGIYCLLAFILPLINLINLEKQDTNDIFDINNNQPTLRSVAIKIAIYTSIALISTLTTTVLSCMVNHTTGTAMTFDLVLNCICVILQFGNVDIKLLPKWFRCVAYLLQCGCFVSNKRSTPTVPPSIIIHPISTIPNTKNIKNNVQTFSPFYTNSSTVNDASHNSVATINWTPHMHTPDSPYSPFDSTKVTDSVNNNHTHENALKIKPQVSSGLILEWKQSSEPIIGGTQKKIPMLESTRSDPLHPK